MNNELMNIVEAIAYLQIPKSTFMNLLRKGEIPVIHITNKTRLIKKADIDKYLDSKRVKYQVREGK